MKKLLMFLLVLTGGIIDAHPSSLKVDINSGIITIDGTTYPIVGFGSYPLPDATCVKAVKQAASDGYRIIDTATFYKNFHAIAEALKEQDRHQFYIISKVWHSQHSPEDIDKDIDWTLTQLQTDYLDAYLLHWPNSTISIEKTLTAMNKLRQEKKIRHIGLSNVTVNHLKRALEFDIPITWVQIEMHPYYFDPELLKFCKENSIVVQTWAPLGNGRVCNDSILEKIGKKHGKTASQVAIRWIIQHGCIPLPNSKNEKHIRENMQVTDFILSTEEMEQLDQRAMKGQRARYAKDVLGFTDEFDFTYEECWPN